MKLDLSGLRSVGKNLVPAVQEGLERALEQTRATASQLAPVRTGALAAGFYTSTRERSGYSQAVSAAMNADPTIQILDEVTQPTEPGIGKVSNVVDYSVFAELGSVHSPAQPSLGPAAQAAQVSFPQELTRSLQDKAFQK